MATRGFFNGPSVGNNHFVFIMSQVRPPPKLILLQIPGYGDLGLQWSCGNGIHYSVLMWRPSMSIQFFFLISKFLLAYLFDFFFFVSLFLCFYFGFLILCSFNFLLILLSRLCFSFVVFFLTPPGNQSGI